MAFLKFFINVLEEFEKQQFWRCQRLWFWQLQTLTSSGNIRVRFRASPSLHRLHCVARDSYGYICFSCAGSVRVVSGRKLSSMWGLIKQSVLLESSLNLASRTLVTCFTTFQYVGAFERFKLFWWAYYTACAVFYCLKNVIPRYRILSIYSSDSDTHKRSAAIDKEPHHVSGNASEYWSVVQRERWSWSTKYCSQHVLGECYT